jgi:hypothetical protein
MKLRLLSIRTEMIAEKNVCATPFLIGFLPLYIPSIPTFHYSIIPCGLSRKWPQKK